MVTFRKAEASTQVLTAELEPENHDLYYDVLELIEGLEEGTLKATGNVQHLAPMVFNVIAEVLNGGFEQAMTNCEHKVMGVAQSFFGERENLNRFAELCDEATQLDLPDEDSGNVDSASAAFETLDQEFYEKKMAVLQELMSMIRESITTEAQASVAGTDPTGEGAPSSETPAPVQTGVEAPVTAEVPTEVDALDSFIQTWSNEQLSITDGTYESWPAEVAAAATALKARMEQLLHEVELDLHDGGYKQ